MAFGMLLRISRIKSCVRTDMCSANNLDFMRGYQPSDNTQNRCTLASHGCICGHGDYCIVHLEVMRHPIKRTPSVDRSHQAWRQVIAVPSRMVSCVYTSIPHVRSPQNRKIGKRISQ